MQDYVNLEIIKKRGSSINPDIHHSKVFSSGHIGTKTSRTLRAEAKPDVGDISVVAAAKPEDSEYGDAAHGRAALRSCCGIGSQIRGS